MAESVVTFTSINVEEIVEQITFSDRPLLMLETLDKRYSRKVLDMHTYVIFDDFSSSAWKLNAYPTGRIFDRSGELRWQQDETGMHSVYLGENIPKQLVASVNILESSELTPKDTDYYLWGKYVKKSDLQDEMGFDEDEDMYIELQIPQYLKYPITAKNPSERMKLLVREFYTRSRHLEYYRFAGMKEA